MRENLAPLPGYPVPLVCILFGFSYATSGEIDRSLDDLARESRASIEVIGHSLEDRPIQALRLGGGSKKILVVAGIHAMEWLSTETALAFASEMARDAARPVELVVVPLLNPDGRSYVVADLARGERTFRRTNAAGVDLNRDFAVHRDAPWSWRLLNPSHHAVTPGPLSQPESRALDALASEGFDAAVSLHAYGGAILYPWAGRFERTPDDARFEALARAMVAAQRRAYVWAELSHWKPFYLALGTELDHLYGRHGIPTFVIELDAGGSRLLRPGTWRDPFRSYNPRDPARSIEEGRDALLGLVRAMQAP